MAKMWEGRFSKEADSRVNDFNSSIAFDCRMYRQDIEGSIAHATMLSECGIIAKSESDAIIKGLNEILAEIERGELTFDLKAEDIHMFIEEELTKRVGDPGKRLHTARSRNDQVALDMRMYLKEKTSDIITEIRKLIEVVCTLSEENLETVMCGYTHLQRAQPITFAHHLMAYAQMFLRDIGRLVDCLGRMDEMPLGSGALATSTYKINRERVAQILGFDKVSENSLDSVSDRDFCMELGSCLSIFMVHLSRLSEEIILWSSWEFKFIELDDAYTTGSSIMPQKKNPDVAELVRGKTGRCIGDLMTLLSMMKNLPLAYNKDMQEDKDAIFDAVDTVELCLSAFTPMLATMTVLKDNMEDAAKGGFITATDCADYLVRKGMPFRTAYKIVGQLVARCIESGNTLDSLDFSEYKRVSDVFEDDVYEAIDLDTCVRKRSVPGGPSPVSVKSQIKNVRKMINEN